MEKININDMTAKELSKLEEVSAEFMVKYFEGCIKLIPEVNRPSLEKGSDGKYIDERISPLLVFFTHGASASGLLIDTLEEKGFTL